VFLSWTSDDVLVWLEGQPGLEKFVPGFRAHGLTGADLADLSHDDLQSIGIDSLSERKAILRAVRALIQTSSS
jgi:hypothetical protein